MGQAGGAGPAGLDVPVFERAVLGWVFANWCECQYAEGRDGMSIKQSEFHLRRIDLARCHLNGRLVAAGGVYAGMVARQTAAHGPDAEWG